MSALDRRYTYYNPAFTPVSMFYMCAHVARRRMEAGRFFTPVTCYTPSDVSSLRHSQFPFLSIRSRLCAPSPSSPSALSCYVSFFSPFVTKTCPRQKASSITVTDPRPQKTNRRLHARVEPGHDIILYRATLFKNEQTCNVFRIRRQR